MDSLVKTTGTTLINSLLDGWDMALEILLIVMALDYLTGVVAAFKTKTVSSSAGYSGLVKKASIFIIVILAAQMDRVIGNDNHIFRNCTALFFTANDAISILENAGKMGMRLPAFLKNALVKLQQQNEQNASQEINLIALEELPKTADLQDSSSAATTLIGNSKKSN